MQSATTTMPAPEYKFKMLKFGSGSISVEPVPLKGVVGQSAWKYLIMGPTGAGQSSFIQALAAPTQDLRIAKDQLGGCTQCVAAYKLVNVRWGSMRYPIYVVDTPGFCDTKISEKEIMDMVRGWTEKSGRPYFDAILFLTPITKPRLAGSNRRTIEMLRAVLKPADKLNSITFVTTMWDQICSERGAKRAEAGFGQLRGEILKEFIDAGSGLTRFSNTRESALQILDSALSFGPTFFSQGMYRESSYLYHDLHDRIEGALQQKQNIESDLKSDDARNDTELGSILDRNLRENEEVLRKFVGQLLEFGKIPEGVEGRRVKELRGRVAREVRAVDGRQEEVFALWGVGLEAPDLDLDLDVGLVTGEVGEREVQPERGLADTVLTPRPTRSFALKSITRRLINATKRRGDKSSS